MNKPKSCILGENTQALTRSLRKKKIIYFKSKKHQKLIVIKETTTEP